MRKRMKCKEHVEECITLYEESGLSVCCVPVEDIVNALIYLSYNAKKAEVVGGVKLLHILVMVIKGVEVYKGMTPEALDVIERIAKQTLDDSSDWLADNCYRRKIGEWDARLQADIGSEG